MNVTLFVLRLTRRDKLTDVPRVLRYFQERKKKLYTYTHTSVVHIDGRVLFFFLFAFLFFFLSKISFLVSFETLNGSIRGDVHDFLVSRETTLENYSIVSGDRWSSFWQ